MFPFLFNKNQFKSRKVKSQEKNLRAELKFYEQSALSFVFCGLRDEKAQNLSSFLIRNYAQ